MLRTDVLPVNTETIWAGFATDLRRFVAGRVPAAAVDDVVQDIFLRIHDRLDQLRDEERLAAWVYRLARNVIVDHLRSERSLDPEVEREVDPEFGPVLDDPRTSLGRWLMATTADLPDHYRQAIERVELRGEATRTVADDLGLSVSGVKSRVQRGRRLLAEKLQRCCHVELDARGGVMDYSCRRPRCCSGG